MGMKKSRYARRHGSAANGRKQHKRTQSGDGKRVKLKKNPPKVRRKSLPQAELEQETHGYRGKEYSREG